MKFQKLAQNIVQQIETELLVFGQRLPSIRKLQNFHKVSKNTVLRALQELELQGYIEAKARQGFYVKWQSRHFAQKTPPEILKPSRLDLPQVFHDIMAKGAAFDCYPSCQETFQSPYLNKLNRAIFNAANKSAAEHSGYYDQPKGLLALRQQLVSRYQLRNCYLHSEDIVITSGCQNALYLALQTVTKPGDTVVVESPAFYGVLQILESLQLQVLEVPISEISGLDIDAVETLCQSQNIAACVVQPTYATPTGACMSEQDKIKLLELAEEFDFYLVEDDIYGELGLLSNPPPLYRFDTNGRVLLCGSWSKSLSRDLRLGWVISSKFNEQLAGQKLNMQLATPRSTQAGLAEFIAKGDYRRHLRLMLQHLATQRSLLISELRQFWPASIEYLLPQGGLTVWLKLPEIIDTQELYQQLLEQGIFLTPGLLFSSDKRYRNYLRLSYLQPIAAERKRALQTVAEVIHSKLQ